MFLKVEEIKSLFGGDEAFMLKLMSKFREDTPETLRNLKKASDDKDWDGAKNSAHKLSSSTQIFRLEELTVILKDIEKSAMDQDKQDQIPQLVEEFEARWRDVVEEMEKIEDEVGK